MLLRQHYVDPIEGLTTDLQSLGQLVVRQVERAIEALEARDVVTAREIICEDGCVNRAQAAIEAQVVATIAMQQPVAGDLQQLLMLLEVASELERVGDYAKKIALIALQQVESSARPPGSLAELARCACAMLAHSMTALQYNDLVAARQLGIDDDWVDTLYQQTLVDLIHMAQTTPVTVTWIGQHMMVAHVLERIADRATNIGEHTIYLATGEMTELNP